MALGESDNIGLVGCGGLVFEVGLAGVDDVVEQAPGGTALPMRIGAGGAAFFDSTRAGRGLRRVAERFCEVELAYESETTKTKVATIVNFDPNP